MRPLVQYDLDDPPTIHSAESLSIGPHPNVARKPPAKKRKRNHQKVHVQHWDDPGSNAVGVVYDEEGSSSMAAGSVSVSFADDAAEEDFAEEVAGADEEDRPLTHGEIWDDSALIDAWNSAQAEYETYHGTSKDWKTEPIKKSPLWYNKPYTPKSGPTARSRHDPSLGQAQEVDGELEPDSAPLDFDTYMPTHDPSLAVPSVPSNSAATAPFFVPPASMATVSRDEAFKNALNAMYWTGYWTAVYHSQAGDTKDNGLAEVDDEDEIDADKSEEENDLTPAQR